jgi:hypothetical protein
VPSTAVTDCPVCLLPGCRGHEPPSRQVCVCARPMLMDSNTDSDRREELVCLKCGRSRPGAYRG